MTDYFMFEKIKKLIENFWHWPILIILAVGFFIGAGSYNHFVQKDDFVKWSSPDETANYTFTKLYAQEGKLQVFEKYNLYAKDIIRPRSLRSDFGIMKPVSFLGIILIFGSIAKLIGSGFIPFLTPFFGGIGIIFFYLFVKELFGRRNALISVLLLASFPVFIYYSARSMFHNVLFIVLFIIGLYFSVLMGGKRLVRKFDWSGFLFSAFAGFFIGLAIITRTSELIWMAPALSIAWIFNIRQVGIFKLVIFFSFVFLALSPVFYFNQILYGSPIFGGYAEMNTSIESIKEASANLAKHSLSGQSSYVENLLIKLRDNIFYFGFHPRHSLKMLYFYFAKMFPFIFWPSILGFFVFLYNWRKLKKRHIVFALSYLAASIILVFYYGSWKINDNPDPNQMTIGNSYTRYWLPVYLGAFPFVSLLILRLTDFKAKNHIADKISYYARFILSFGLRIVSIGFIFYISMNLILRGSDEGLLNTYKVQRAAKMEYDKVLSLTEGNSVIITKYHDKLFFPERKVIMGLFTDDNMNREYANLAKLIPVYYYNFTFPEKDIDYLNNKRLPQFGLEIKEVEKISDSFTLYKLDLKKINHVIND